MCLKNRIGGDYSSREEYISDISVVVKTIGVMMDPVAEGTMNLSNACG